MMTAAHCPKLRMFVLQVYYYNTLTNESSWEKPKDYAGDVNKASAQLTPVSTQPVKGTEWSEVVCADGRKYYFNSSTQVETPADLTVLRSEEEAFSAACQACSIVSGSTPGELSIRRRWPGSFQGCCQVACVTLQETSWTAPPEVKAVLGKKPQVQRKSLACLIIPHLLTAFTLGLNGWHVMNGSKSYCSL